jgi:hypothetical protein
MPLNLPVDVWIMLAGAGLLFTLALLVIFVAYRLLR